MYKLHLKYNEYYIGIYFQQPHIPWKVSILMKKRHIICIQYNYK